MSEKKYEIDYNQYTDKYEITEVDTPSYDYTPNTDPTFREKLHDKLINMSRAGKIILTFFFNLYGSLFRLSSNTAIGFLIGLADLIAGKIMMIWGPFMILTGEIFDDAASNIRYEVTTDINGAEIIDAEAYEMSENILTSSGIDEIALLFICLLPLIIYMVDVISVLKTNTIVLLGDKKYPNYSDYKKTHK